MNALLFERPVWFATGPFAPEEEGPERDEFIYHRPVLVPETIELLAARPGATVLDATCGGGGHSEALLKTGVDVLALDQDPDANIIRFTNVPSSGTTSGFTASGTLRQNIVIGASATETPQTGRGNP